VPLFHKFAGKGAVEQREAKLGGLLQSDFDLLFDACECGQPSLHFSHDTFLFGRRGERDGHCLKSRKTHLLLRNAPGNPFDLVLNNSAANDVF
jgi:hypothetical protein